MHELETIESPEFSVSSQQVDLAEIARQTSKMLNAKAQAKSITLAAEVGESGPFVRGDPVRVLQILLNLAGNAINYSPEGSLVSLGTGDDGSISVGDEGPGLSADQQSRIFAKFERLGRSGDGGSGLGLYISRKLAEAMGGALSISSAPGEGATFTLHLPEIEGAKSAQS